MARGKNAVLADKGLIKELTESKMRMFAK